jgi:hypothetical protein
MEYLIKNKMDNNLFRQIGIVDTDGQRLESIRHLEKAFNEVKESYSREYDQTLTNVIEQIKNRMKQNLKMRQAVDGFIQSYVSNENKKTEATEVLYGMLAAELAQTFQALSHTSCSIM